MIYSITGEYLVVSLIIISASDAYYGSCKENALGICFKLYVTVLVFQNITYKV